MADPSAAPGADHDEGSAVQPGQPGTAGTPRWVKAFLVVGAVLVLLLALGKVTGVGGDHGPARHGGGAGAPSSVVEEDGARP